MRVCSFVLFLLSSIQLLQLTYQYPGTEFLKFFFLLFSHYIHFILYADVVVVVVVVVVV